MRCETIGLATLYHGDCREVLPCIGAVGMVATDPPYGIEQLVGGYGRGGRTIQGDRDLTVCLEGLALAAAQIEAGHVFAFYSCRVTPQFFEAAIEGLEYLGEIIWDKRAPGMGAPIRYQHENIAIFAKGDAPDLGPIISVRSHYRRGVVHPHEKPVPLMRDIIACGQAEPVLDPFMGSGSTGVAAAQLGKRFIGIEKDDAYFDLACRRIAEAQAIFDQRSGEQQQLFAGGSPA